MRVRLLAATAALGVLCGLGSAVAQDNGGGSDHQKLDRVLAVLRLRTVAAGKPCLDAMNDVHQTEDQVKDLTKDGTSSSSDKPNTSLDIARDVLGSDYETATEACAPDAIKVCADNTDAGLVRACQGLRGPQQ